MADKDKIKEEIERLDEKYRELRVNGTIQQAKEADLVVHVLQQLNNFIDSLPEEPASEDLEEEISKWRNHYISVLDNNLSIDLRDIEITANHFAEWQKQKDEKLFKEDTWNYIEEQYPDVIKEEKLRLYDISIKSRLAGANAIKQQMKEALQTEYEKGWFDMREEMMKDAVKGEVVYQIGSSVLAPTDIQYKVVSDRVYIPNVKLGDKVKVIIVKTEQQ